jgi:hypothetical protein
MIQAFNVLKPSALTRGTLVASLLLGDLLLYLPASAQTSPPPATATRPGSPEQTSVPNNAPPSSRTQTTGEVSRDPTIKKMNEDEKRKVEKEGK